MSRTFHNARLPRLVALVAALLLAAFAVVVTSSPARAHDELLGSDPAAGSSVGALPAELRLTFSGAIAAEPGASEVRVTDASGAALVDGAPTAQDNVLTQPLAGEASGAVTVLWKVVSSDGHPISGEFSFTVSAPAVPTATPTGTAAPTPTAIAPTLIEEDPNMTVDPVATLLVNLLPWLLAAAVAALIIALIVGSRRRRRGPSELDSRPGSEPPAAH